MCVCVCEHERVWVYFALLFQLFSPIFRHKKVFFSLRRYDSAESSMYVCLCDVCACVDWLEIFPLPFFVQNVTVSYISSFFRRLFEHQDYHLSAHTHTHKHIRIQTHSFAQTQIDRQKKSLMKQEWKFKWFKNRKNAQQNTRTLTVVREVREVKERERERKLMKSISLRTLE